MTDHLPTRRFTRLALALGLALAGASAHAQDMAASPAVTGTATQGDTGAAAAQPAQEAQPARHSRGEIHPYLEVSQVLSADLDGGDTLTYTSFAVGVDGHVETRRVAAQMGLRYERHVEWEGNLPDSSFLSGAAMAHLEVAPNLLSFDVGGLATRTAGPGQAVGVTNQSQAVNVYSLYAGPTLSTYAGPVAINASYRFGYNKIDDDRVLGNLDDAYDSSTAHSFTASAGMAPGQLPFGWTIGGGYAREDFEGIYDNQFEGGYVRADVVVPVGPTLALTAGVGYEDLQSSQYDFVRDPVTGNVVLGPGGLPVPDPNAPRVLTYDLEGVMYDGGIIWRPSPRTELQARVGHRYGGTTFTGSLSHQLNEHESVNLSVFDTVETFGLAVANNIIGLPSNSNITIDPITGQLTGCTFGTNGGGTCLANPLQTITPSTFRARGANFVFAGSRGLWDWGLGAGYTHHEYFQPLNAPTAVFATEDENFGVSASLGRQLTRESHVAVGAYANWYSSDVALYDDVTTHGFTMSYDHTFLLDRLQLLAAMGLYHSDNGVFETDNFSAMLGLRFTF